MTGDQVLHWSLINGTLKGVEWVVESNNSSFHLLQRGIVKNFILPGGHTTVSFCHIARTVCRRAERKVVALHHNEAIDEIIIRYLNRLSDYLFVLGRKLSQDLNAEEIAWHPRTKK